jgi:hypothetical protein
MFLFTLTHVGAPTTRCVDWAKASECVSNPAFMWAECKAECKALGLREPWEEMEEIAHAGPPVSAQILELSFASETELAPIRISFRADLSPRTVASVVAAIGLQREGAASFYRNEAVPEGTPTSCGSILCGPYALIQGRLSGLAATPAEGVPIVRRGFVARIQESADL